MVVTTTPKPSKKPSKPSKPNKTPEDASSLLACLKADFPDFTFKPGSKFAWRPPKTIVLGPQEPHFNLLMLHELGHATLGHTAFKTHVERLKMEVAAWQQAKIFSKTYNIPYNEDFVESQLDTYRDWLHAKSLCPNCKLTRYQLPSGEYICPLCDRR